MSDLRVERHYGFGAARVALSPQPHRYAQSIGAAMRDAGGDFYLSSLPPMIMAAFMCAALFVTVSEDRGYTNVEVVMIERELHGLDEEVVEIPPVVEPVAKKPEPCPEPRTSSGSLTKMWSRRPKRNRNLTVLPIPETRRSPRQPHQHEQHPPGPGRQALAESRRDLQQRPGR